MILLTGFDAADANVDHPMTHDGTVKKRAVPAFSGTDRECVESFRLRHDAARKYGIAGEKCLAFCLDTGRLLLAGMDDREAMIRLGDRIEVFHVHDNNGMRDQLLAPYMGVLYRNRFVEGLRAIRFGRTLSFETFGIWNVVDRELAPAMMRFIAETGRTFALRAAEQTGLRRPQDSPGRTAHAASPRPPYNRKDGLIWNSIS